ncbi:MAG: bifunctional adenosylcobinamide kinase/adenosylcobinamide-phosphate guanylyltransferase [Austwickia sp.]|jgi:adenosylcobinamide kinase/adenosylcobinamide-phosphate guanylyltransferase|nr:MAG: bifunctional adenosylcobinamide kinase/adenosylcobinamide-phosphate guanylyltransferase [Austwickia sp.]
MTSILVLGGVRSGKSRYAERLLADAAGVRYVAPGPVPDPAADPDWAERVRLHQDRRPAHWETWETARQPAGLAEAVATAPRAVLVDCLGTWLAGLVHEAQAWDDRDRATEAVDHGLDGLIAALAVPPGPVVLVTNEVGLGVVPEHASGRLFRDLLGRINARVAEACDHVALVVAGRVLDLTAAPTVAAAAPLPSASPEAP